MGAVRAGNWFCGTYPCAEEVPPSRLVLLIAPNGPATTRFVPGGTTSMSDVALRTVVIPEVPSRKGLGLMSPALRSWTIRKPPWFTQARTSGSLASSAEDTTLLSTSSMNSRLYPARLNALMFVICSGVKPAFVIGAAGAVSEALLSEKNGTTVPGGAMPELVMALKATTPLKLLATFPAESRAVSVTAKGWLTACGEAMGLHCRV